MMRETGKLLVMGHVVVPEDLSVVLIEQLKGIHAQVRGIQKPEPGIHVKPAASFDAQRANEPSGFVMLSSLDLH